MNVPLLILVGVVSPLVGLLTLRYVVKRRNIPLRLWPFRIPWTVVLLGGYHLVLGIAVIVIGLAFLNGLHPWLAWVYVGMALAFIVLGAGLLVRWRWTRPVLTSLWAIWAVADVTASVILLRGGRAVSYVHWAPAVVLVVVVLGLYANRRAREYFSRQSAAA